MPGISFVLKRKGDPLHYCRWSQYCFSCNVKTAVPEFSSTSTVLEERFVTIFVLRQFYSVFTLRSESQLSPCVQVRAGLALYDTMRSMGFPVTTLNLGIAASIRFIPPPLPASLLTPCGRPAPYHPRSFHSRPSADRPPGGAGDAHGAPEASGAAREKRMPGAPAVTTSRPLARSGDRAAAACDAVGGGAAAAAGSGFLCGAGDKGKRMALPNARFLLQTPKLEDM